MDLDRVLITGGTRGIGRAIAAVFVARGARVAVTFERDAHAASVFREQHPGALVFQGSVGDEAHVKAVVGELTEVWGGIDVLVNNAGRTRILPVALLEPADWDAMHHATARGTYLFSRGVLRSMIRARHGRILTLGNFAIERIVDTPVHYAAAKAAALGFTRSLAREVGRYGITVNCLSPGILQTGMGELLPQHRLQQYLDQCPAGRLGTAEEVAQTALFMLDTPFMTGAHVVCAGGI